VLWVSLVGVTLVRQEILAVPLTITECGTAILHPQAQAGAGVAEDALHLEALVKERLKHATRPSHAEAERLGELALRQLGPLGQQAQHGQAGALGIPVSTGQEGRRGAVYAVLCSRIERRF
jgi:hypothetical protein